MSNNSKILRMNDICKMIGVSKSTVHRLIKDGGFVEKVIISKRAVGYMLEDVEEWIRTRKM